MTLEDLEVQIADVEADASNQWRGGKVSDSTSLYLIALCLLQGLLENRLRS